ncbi:MAG: DUF166 domain-containing protein, partial [Candidatus Hodarchaeota archaeon]
LILLFQRGFYGERVVETIRKYTKKLEISKIFKIPKELPDIIEEPENYIPDKLFKNIDLIISYSLHADLSQYIVEKAKNNGIKVVIIPGEDPSFSQLGARRQLFKIAEDEVDIFSPEVTCALKPVKDNDIIKIFCSEIGHPEFKIETKEGKISKVDVIRGAPCGATWYVANGIIGETVKEAPQKAALLTQYYCRASRGYDIIRGEGKIHKAGKITMKAFEKAIEEIIINKKE